MMYAYMETDLDAAQGQSYFEITLQIPAKFCLESAYLSHYYPHLELLELVSSAPLRVDHQFIVAG